MKKDLEQIFKSAKEFSLTENERKSILNNIIDTDMSEKVENVRNISSSRLYDIGGISTLTSRYSRISLMRYRTTLMSLAVTIALLGTTGAYAKMSLPGELLYPVKIHISEKLEYISAITPKTQAVLEATFATRRLEEAAALLHANRLTKSQSTELAAQYSSYTGKLIEHLGELRRSGDGEDANKINSSFEASVQTHQVILNVFQASSSKNGNLSPESDGTSTKIKSTYHEEMKVEGEESAPFVTTPITSGQESGATANIKATNTVEVPPYLDDLKDSDELQNLLKVAL